jgi:O-antigen/teichoic acid export membrane protein
LFPIFVHFLSPSDYGIIGLNATLTAVFSIFFTMGFDSAFSLYYFKYKKNEKVLFSYLSTTLLSVIAISILLILTTIPVGDYFFSILFKDKTYSFYPFGLISLNTAFLNAINVVILSYYRNSHKAMNYFYLAFSNFFCGTVFEGVAILVFHCKAEGVLLARLLGTFLPSMVIYVHLFRYIGVSYDFRFVRISLLYSTPLVLYSILTFVYTSYDRVMIENYLSFKELGLYNVAITISSIVEIGFYAIQYSVMPELYRLLNNFKDNEAKINFINIGVGWIVLFIVSCVMTFTPVFLHFFTKEIYWITAQLIPILCVGYIFRYLFSVYSMSLFYFHKTARLPIIAGAGAILTIISNTILLPRIGLIGAAFSMLIVRGAIVPLTIFFSHKASSFRIKLKSFRLVLFTYCAYLLIISFLKSNFNNKILLAYSLPLILIVLLGSFKIYKNWSLIKERDINNLQKIFS